MEQTTFQQRIEERAMQRLEKDLLKWSNDLHSIAYAIGREDLKQILYASSRYDSYNNKSYIVIHHGQEIFDKLLPQYIAQVTDEILQKVDEIDWLLQEKKEQDY